MHPSDTCITRQQMGCVWCNSWPCQHPETPTHPPSPPSASILFWVSKGWVCTSCCLCTIGWENGNYSAFHFSSIHAVMAAGRCWCSQIDGIILLKPLDVWPYLASVLEPSFGFVLYHLQGCHEKLSIIMPRMTNTPPSTCQCLWYFRCIWCLLVKERSFGIITLVTCRWLLKAPCFCSHL